MFVFAKIRKNEKSRGNNEVKNEKSRGNNEVKNEKSRGNDATNPKNLVSLLLTYKSESFFDLKSLTTKQLITT
ncbi:hypothetical protein FACS1894162_2230 [Bacteroidia bacterium]|nr:hypothetical protein FACS1894162_2230 [Bacteroidia bacterium]